MKDFHRSPKVTRHLTSIDLLFWFFNPALHHLSSDSNRKQKPKHIDLPLWPILPIFSPVQKSYSKEYNLIFLGCGSWKLCATAEFQLRKVSHPWMSYSFENVKFTEPNKRYRMDTCCTSCGVDVFTCGVSHFGVREPNELLHIPVNLCT